MTGNFDDDTDWRDFDTLDDYIEFRLHEGMQGHDYSFSNETMADWAEIFIDQHDWYNLQSWMGWSPDEMSDFFDWWREMYENA